MIQVRTTVGATAYDVRPFATAGEVFVWQVQFQIIPTHGGYADATPLARAMAAFLQPYVEQPLEALSASELSALGDRIVWASSLPPELLRGVGAFWDIATKADRYDRDQPVDPACECRACLGRVDEDPACRYADIPATAKTLTGVQTILDYPELWDRPYWLLQLKRRLEGARAMGRAAPWQEQERKRKEGEQARAILDRLGIGSWAELGRA